eukprot:m.216964 g.216964  ORF g.216964 m.216964 type:complete len:76 (+) comp33221_c0_seq2:312-539(+)
MKSNPKHRVIYMRTRANAASKGSFRDFGRSPHMYSPMMFSCFFSLFGLAHRQNQSVSRQREPNENNHTPHLQPVF